MNKIVRTSAPEWLRDKWEDWGIRWEERYAQAKKNGKSIQFNWPQVDNEKVDKKLRPLLSEMTKEHCSFCDAYPMGKRLQNTVEHFRPKKKFPLLVCQWENLFLCCRLCQTKGDAFDDRLLKPDDDTYHFDEYFIINWDTGELKPNPAKSEKHQAQAQITIKLYRLNENGKPEDRLEELEKFIDSRNPELDKYAYRFFIKRGGPG